MIYRLLSVCIIVFWMVMTGLLVQKVWFPAESRLAEVDPKAVFERFAERARDSQLEIFRGQEVIGTLRAVPYPHGSVKSPHYRFTVNGYVILQAGVLPEATKLNLDGRLALSAAGEIPAMKLILSLGQPKFSLEILKAEKDPVPSIRLAQGSRTLFDTALLPPGAGGGAVSENPLAALLLPMIGLSAGDLDQVQRTATAAANATKITARHGNFVVQEKSYSGYIVASELNGRAVEGGFKLYLDNSGEILRLEAPGGLTLINRDLLPEEMHAPDF